jgi:hypothetical protein
MTFTAGQKARASQMPGYVCTSGTRPTGHSGQIIYETDTGMTAIYTGSAWYYLAPTGEIASDAEYQANATQTISTGANTFAAFGQNNFTSPLVTKGVTGAGHYFRLVRAGRWAISCTIRWASAATGERYSSLRCGGTRTLASQGSALSGTNAVTQNTSVLKRISAAEANTSAADVDVLVFQNSGGNRDLEFSDTNGYGRINFAWLGP